MIIDALFGVALVLNSTGLFRFLAPQCGVSIGAVSTGLLFLNVLYLLLRFRCSLRVVTGRAMVLWLVLLLVWPYATAVYAPAISVRDVGLQLYFATLFVGTVVYTIRNGINAAGRLFLASLIITVFGLVLSLLMPGYFETVSILADAEADRMGRPFGFFLQANRLALNQGLLFLAWYALWPHKTKLREAFVFGIFILSMLVVGSRTGMILTVLVLTLILLHSWRERLRGAKLLNIAFLVTVLAISYAAVEYSIARADRTLARRDGDLIDRVDRMIHFWRDDGREKADGSLRLRLEAQRLHLAKALESPILGKGFASSAYYLHRGDFPLTAHSEAITSAMEYGFLYPVAFGLLILHFYVHRSRRTVEAYLRTNAILQFVLVVLMLFSYSSLFDKRTFYVVLGVFFALVYRPQEIFGYVPTLGVITGPLHRKQLMKRRSPDLSVVGNSVQSGRGEELVALGS